MDSDVANDKPISAISKKKLTSPLPILVLQHPQEPREVRGTVARLLETFSPSAARVGLSWANLKRALEKTPFTPPERARDWAVLYLGSAKLPPAEPCAPNERIPGRLFALTSKGTLDSKAQTELSQIKGLVVLDGTWSQSKTLWWRNAWLLKLRRVALVPAPQIRSRYAETRKEPRRECLSTLEATGLALSCLTRDAQYFETAQAQVAELAEQFRSVQKTLNVSS